MRRLLRRHVRQGSTRWVGAFGVGTPLNSCSVLCLAFRGESFDPVRGRDNRRTSLGRTVVGVGVQRGQEHHLLFHHIPLRKSKWPLAHDRLSSKVRSDLLRAPFPRRISHIGIARATASLLAESGPAVLRLSLPGVPAPQLRLRPLAEQKRERHWWTSRRTCHASCTTWRLATSRT